VRGRRNWEHNQDARDAVYANRRRIRGHRGRRLLCQRGEYLERPFAHAYETGGLGNLQRFGTERVAKIESLQEIIAEMSTSEDNPAVAAQK